MGRLKREIVGVGGKRVRGWLKRGRGIRIELYFGIFVGFPKRETDARGEGVPTVIIAHGEELPKFLSAGFE